MLISAGLLIILTKIRFSGRIGNQLYVIMLIFWSGIFIISFNPRILDSVLNNTGLVNRSQFLLICSILIILYLLVIQILRNKGLSFRMFNVIRKTALSNFKEVLDTIPSVEVLIIIAAKNESKTIATVIDKIKSIHFDFSYVILVVNDGSTDDTALIAKKHKALLINHGINLGVGAAIKTGFLASEFLKPKIVVNIDGDDQHDPKDIQKIVNKIKNENYDLVYASRFLESTDYEQSITRKIGNKFYTNLVNKITNLQLTDVTSGFRGVRFEKLPSVLFLSESNFAIELALRASKNNLRVIEIPTKASIREHGKSQLYKIENFIIYNFNVLRQIINAYN